MSPPKKIPKVVKVWWVDAETIGHTDWMGTEESSEAARNPLPVMITVGFVLHSNDTMVSLTSTIGPDQTAQVHKIPRQMIVKIEDLR